MIEHNQAEYVLRWEYIVPLDNDANAEARALIDAMELIQPYKMVQS